MNPIVYKSVVNTCFSLTTDELDSLYLCVITNQNPKDKNYVFDYEKVKGLFTESDGLRVHNDVKEVLRQLVLARHQ